MKPLRMLWSKLRGLVQARALDRDLQEEIDAHLEEATSEFAQQGLSAAEARRAALLSFGGISQTQQLHREVRAFPWLDQIRFAWRAARCGLGRNPGSSTTAVLTLALGIGATTAVFSVVYGVLLKPLPFQEPDRLVALYLVTPATERDSLPGAAYFTFRENGRAFEDIGLWQGANVSVIRNSTPEQVPARRVTDSTLSLLGVRAQLGRLFLAEDGNPGAPLRVILTHGYWQDAFGGSPDAVGQSLVIDSRPYEIIGVLPASFRWLGANPRILLPIQLDRANTRIGVFAFNGLARLKSDVTITQANDDVARMIPLIAKQFPLMPGLTQEMWDAVGLAPNVRPLAEVVIGDMSRPLWILLGTVAIVLLMAWANVANLLLVRTEGRQRELAVRGALGASRGRIAADLLAESLVLGLTGGALGILFAQAGVAWLWTMAPAALPRVADIRIDGVVLLVTLVTSVATSVVFGFIPVLKSRAFNADLLKEAGRSTDPPGRHRTRNTLAVVQITFALVLLVVSGLMARTFIAMRQVEPGFVRPAELQTFGITLPAALIRDPPRVLETFEQIAARLKQVAGVQSVGLGVIRMDGFAAKAPVFVEGRPVSGLPPVGFIRSIGPGYFETMGNRVLAGRTITRADIAQLRRVAVVSENLARQYWNRPANAIGGRIRLFDGVPWTEIVGVVGDERADGLNHPAPRLVYLPMANEESVSRSMTYVVRSTRTGTPGFFLELQQAVWSIAPTVPLAEAKTVEDIQAASMSQTSFGLVMLGLAASVALVLALVGIYGVVSYIAAERTHEIGIRMALGAQRRDVRRLLLRHGLLLALVGIALGTGAAMLVTPIMSALLYGVSPTDPVTYAAVAIALGGVTLLATYLPARRASRLSPTIALRSQV
jgi:predicted permease